MKKLKSVQKIIAVLLAVVYVFVFTGCNPYISIGYQVTDPDNNIATDDIDINEGSGTMLSTPLNTLEQTPERTPEITTTEIPEETTPNTPVKTTQKTPVKTITKTPDKTAQKTPVKTTPKTPEKTPVKTVAKTATNTVKTEAPTAKPTQKPETLKPIVLKPPAEYEELYNIMLEKFRKGEMQFDLASYFSKHNIKYNGSYINKLMSEVFGYILDYNPDIFYISSYSMRYSYYEESLKITKAIFEAQYVQGYSDSNINSLKQSLEQKVSELVNKINSMNLSPFEKELWIHDYLVKNIVYDISVKSTSHNAASALLNGTAVCDGYSKAFQLLMNRVGIETYVVSGTVGKSNPEDHMWNIVKLNNKFYHVDVTHDDPLPDRGADAPVIHTNLNQPDAVMSMTHNWNPEDAPDCTSYDMNYFNVMNLLANDINSMKNILNRIVTEQKDKNVDQRFAEIMFSSNMPGMDTIKDEAKKVFNSQSYNTYYFSNIEKNTVRFYKWN